MTMTTVPAAGAIYDIGYRSYEGARLGRGYAFRTLFAHSLATVWGLGRPGRAKVVPFLLTALIAFPAVIQVLVAAASQGQAKLLSYENYFGFLQGIIALFCAAQAPELVSNDQQHRVLPLYFSRPLRRWDYAAAKLLAMMSAVLLLMLLPMAIIFLGKLSVATDVLGAVRTEAGTLPEIFAAAAVIALCMASLSVALASLTPRRAIASAAVLGATMMTAAMSQILGEVAEGAVERLAPLLSPVITINGVIEWIFQVPAGKLAPGAPLPLDGTVYLAGALGWAALTTAILFYRYSRVNA
jgi:ABC-2 type transport system permease protein